MRGDMILPYWNMCVPERFHEFQLAIQCAPVLMGASLGNIVSVKAEIWEQISLPSALNSAEISVCLLWNEGRRAILLIYRKSELEQYLKETGVKILLQKFGYSSCNVQEVLSFFCQRYERYQKSKTEFPHELGLILGYPAADVEGYIVHQGKDFLIAGYWKVYEEPRRAEEMFRQYDAARLWAARQVAGGCTLNQIFGSRQDRSLFMEEKL